MGARRASRGGGGWDLQPLPRAPQGVDRRRRAATIFGALEADTERGGRDEDALWRYSSSGDFPINHDDVPLTREDKRLIRDAAGAACPEGSRL